MNKNCRRMLLPLWGIIALVLVLAPHSARAAESSDAETTLLTHEELDTIEDFYGLSGVETQSTSPQSLPTTNFVVALDAGHGGSDSGAVGFFTEKDLNLRIARACAQELESRGVQTVLIRDSDTYVFSSNAALELQARCTKAYQAGASVYVSLHCNAGNGNTNGAEVWYPQNVPFNNYCYTTGRGLANAVLTKLTENNKYGIGARGIFTRDYNEDGGSASYSDGSSYDYYAVIRHSREYGIPGIIVEHGFIDNASDAQSLNANAEAMGRDDADAIYEYFYSNASWEHTSDGRWRLWNGTSYVTSSWEKIGDSWYWLDAEGYRATGWQNVGGNRYHFSDSGVMDYGWLNEGGTWYWLGGPNDGALYTHGGWLGINGSWYHFSTSGTMDTGWLKDGGIWYWLGASNDGALAGGWRLIGGKWYYLHNSHDGHFGEMHTGWALINGTWYWLDPNTGAAIQSTTCAIGGSTYAFTNSCAMGQDGWCLVNGTWYWASHSGALESGWKLVRGTWYWMDPTTFAMATGWLNLNGTRYYLLPSSGAMVTGHVLIDGTWYDFDESGALASSSNTTTAQSSDSNGSTGTDSGTTSDDEAATPLIYLDAGHGPSGSGYDSGATGSGYVEATETSELAAKVASYARSLYGVNVYVNSNSNVNFTERQQHALSLGATAYVSLHFNSASEGATGTESYIYSNLGGRYKGSAAAGSKEIQTIMHTRLVNALGLTDRGMKANAFAVCNGGETGIPATLLEICFISNPLDMRVYKNREEKVAQALAAGLNDIYVMQGGKASSEPIMGQSKATKADMVAFYKASGHSYPTSVYASKGASSIEEFVTILIDVANSEGVRPDVVFCQAMLETGYLQFGGDVQAEQCNFAGIGATGGGNPGNSFADVREGLLAQVQHLKAYASTDALNNPCVDPRFEYLKDSRGVAPYVANLSQRWATSATYGYDITKMLVRLDAMS